MIRDGRDSHRHRTNQPRRQTMTEQTNRRVGGGPVSTRSMRLVAPEFIAAQRDAGWPDIHPEDYCHRCGTRNPLWFTDRETWEVATAAWATQTGREGICCPWCLAEMHEHATGKAATWVFVPQDVVAERDAVRAEVAYLRDRLDRTEAELEQAHGERDALAAIVTQAALETYTPDGAEKFVAEFHRVIGERDALAAKVARVEALAGRWESPGLVCDCGHDLGQHNSNGCYARITYKPTVIVCSCTETDDRYEDDFAIRDLRAALAGEDDRPPSPPRYAPLPDPVQEDQVRPIRATPEGGR